MKAKTDPNAKRAARIFIVEDHVVFRQGLTWILEQEGFQVVGNAADADEALERVRKLKPDLIIVDIALAGVSGLEFTRKVRAALPDVRILILSMHKESLYAERALRAGANGYIMKKESGEELVSALRMVLAGQTYVSKQFNEVLLQKVSGSGRNVQRFSLDLLSDREIEVFERVGQGLGTRQIAEELAISMKTIEAHKEHIRAKLDLKTNSELVQHAIHWVHTEKDSV